MKTMMALPALAALMACTTTGAGEDSGRVMMDGEGCDANNTADFIGRPATAELGAEVQRRTGGRSFRWLQPGQVVTMEYRGDRVNVHLDEQNNVRSINCG